MQSTTQAAPDIKLDFATRSLMLLGGVLAAMALTAIASVLPAIDHDLAHNARDHLLVKQLIGGVGLAMVVGATLGGFLADKFGLRSVIIVAALIYTIAGTAGLYLTSLPWLLASRLLLGCSAAVIQVMSMTLINRYLSGAARAKWMGIHISLALMGTIVVHPVAGALGELGWRWPFALYAVGAALVLAMLASSAHSLRAPRAAEASARQGSSILVWFPWHYPVLALLIGSTVYLPMVYIPFLLREVGGATSSTIALILMADSIAGAAMAFAYGWARQRLSTHGAFIFSFAATGVGTLVAVLSDGFVGIIVGLVIYGFGVGWLAPNMMTGLGAKVSADQQGRAAGIVKAANFLAAPLTLVVMEPFSSRYGNEAAIVAVSALSFCLVLVFVLSAAQSATRARKAAAA